MKTIKFPLKKPSPHTNSPDSNPETDPEQSSLPKEEVIRHRQKFNELVTKSNQVLYRAKSMFPFDIFPDEIIVSKDKVDIIYGIFFYSRQVFPLKLDNIESVILDYDLFFGSVEFKVTGFKDYQDRIRFLRKHDALMLKRIIMGLVICHREQVDITRIDIDEARKKLEEIGKAEDHE